MQLAGLFKFSEIFSFSKITALYNVFQGSQNSIIARGIYEMLGGQLGACTESNMTTAISR